MHDPIPIELALTPFTVADAERFGLRRFQLRRRALVIPFRGVRSLGPPVGLAERSRAYQAKMPPGQFFSHATAAGLLGVPLPALPDDRLHVSCFHPLQPPRASGIVGHQLHDSAIRCRLLGEFPITSAADTWCLLGSQLADDDLVVAGDYLVGGDFPLTTIDELRSTVARRTGSRGVAVASKCSSSTTTTGPRHSTRRT